ALDQRRNDLSKRRTDYYCDCQVDHVSTSDELFEFLPHGCASCCLSVTVLSCFESCFLCFCRSLEQYLIRVGDLFRWLAAGRVVSLGVFVGDYLGFSAVVRVAAGFSECVLLFFCLSSFGDEIIRSGVYQSKTWTTRDCRHDQLKVSATQLLPSRLPRRPVAINLQRLRDQL